MIFIARIKVCAFAFGGFLFSHRNLGYCFSILAISVYAGETCSSPESSVTFRDSRRVAQYLLLPRMKMANKGCHFIWFGHKDYYKSEGQSSC